MRAFKTFLLNKQISQVISWLSSATNYLYHWPTKENVVCYRNKVFAARSLVFLEQKQNRNPLENSLFLLKKNNESEMRNPKIRMQCLSNYRIKKWTNISKRRNNLHKSLENVFRRVLWSQSNMYHSLQKIGNKWKPLSILQNGFIIDIWQDSKYAPGIQFSIQFAKALWSSNKLPKCIMALLNPLWMDTHWKDKKIFLSASVRNFFLTR